MRCLVFDIEGDYALFKKPYSPMSPVSYPLPPPTVVLGILGAILGYGKDDYHEKLDWQNVRVGVRLLKPVQTFTAALNWLNTKDGTDNYFRPLAEKNPHIQIPCQFLKNPAYRIYVSGLNDENADRLAGYLSQGYTEYTPVLGLASCLADVSWVGEWDALPSQKTEWQSRCAVALDESVKIHYQDRRRYHRLRVPADMDAERIVHRYQEIVLAEDGAEICGSGGEFFEVNGETISFL